MKYEPYKNMNCWNATFKFLRNQNVLMKMANMTLLSMYLSVTVFLILLTYSLYNDLVFTRLAHAVLVDVILNFINIYLQIHESDSAGKRIHEFVPEGFRALALIFYYVYAFQTKDNTLIYLTFVYAIPILYRLVSWTRYSKIKFFGVSLDDPRNSQRFSSTLLPFCS